MNAKRGYPQAERAIRDWLRTKHKGRANPVPVTPREASEATGVYLNTAGSVLTALAGRGETGLVAVRPGRYEYTWTEDSLANPLPEEKHYIQPEVLAEFQNNPGHVFTIAEMTRRVHGNFSSVASAMSRLSRSPDVPVRRAEGVSGLYVLPAPVTVTHVNDTAPEPEPPEPAPELPPWLDPLTPPPSAIDRGGSGQVEHRAPARLPEVENWPQQPPQGEPPASLETLGNLADGSRLVRDQDQNLWKLSPLGGGEWKLVRM